MSSLRTTFLLCSPASVSPSSSSSSRLSLKSAVSCCSVVTPDTVVNGKVNGEPFPRNEVRLGLPSKGRMATDTLDLLKDCQLSVRQANPRQYVADIPQISNLEVWFQRPKDIVRKLVSGDLDIGIVGLDTVMEYGQGNEDLILVHDALDYGECRLSLAIPKYGIFENINSLKELAQMPQWTPNRPLRVATGFTYLSPKFLKQSGLKHVTFSTADGALEAAPAMSLNLLDTYLLKFSYSIMQKVLGFCFLSLLGTFFYLLSSPFFLSYFMFHPSLPWLDLGIHQ